MRGWPGDFPTAPHKGRPPAALPQKAPSHSGPGGGRGSRGPAHPTWPPPSRACVHRGRSCPLTTAGAGGPQGWALGGSLFSHPASHPPSPLAQGWHSSWVPGRRVSGGTLPILSVATIGLPHLPFCRPHALAWPRPAGTLPCSQAWPVQCSLPHLLPYPPAHLVTQCR